MATFKNVLNAGPADYGISLSQAAHFGDLANRFTAAFALCNNNDTNSQSATVAKNEAKRAAIADARMLAGIIQKYPATTDTQRSVLGLTVPSKPSRILPPADRPMIRIVSVVGRTVRIWVRDSQAATRRIKPDGVMAGCIYSYVGETPPTDLIAYRFEQTTSKTSAEIVFPASVASGATVWLCARWINPRGEAGPASSAISTTLQGGVARAAA